MIYSVYINFDLFNKDLKMLQVNQSFDSGYTVYSFEANNTEYEVLTEDNATFQVWSKRKGLSGRTAPKVYFSLAEMAKRSKALSHLATLIAA